MAVPTQSAAPFIASPPAPAPAPVPAPQAPVMPAGTAPETTPSNPPPPPK